MGGEAGGVGEADDGDKGAAAAGGRATRMRTPRNGRSESETVIRAGNGYPSRKRLSESATVIRVGNGYPSR